MGLCNHYVMTQGGWDNGSGGRDIVGKIDGGVFWRVKGA